MGPPKSHSVEAEALNQVEVTDAPYRRSDRSPTVSQLHSAGVIMPPQVEVDKISEHWSPKPVPGTVSDSSGSDSVITSRDDCHSVAGWGRLGSAVWLPQHLNDSTEGAQQTEAQVVADPLGLRGAFG